ncbi:MAG: HD domain-containing protein [Planctomycetia bacterium]|nr:HD domain-containing protein [Planctomycetia bacterium]
MYDFDSESLSHDPIHGYIPFVARRSGPDEVAEQEIIDHPWVQRLRFIHQLQTAWWVFPSAEHTRFQHVLGAMHLASRAVARLYDSLRQQCPDVPSRACVETLMRLAALLHDVGHGPFGHFLDDHFLQGFGLTHETLGSVIIREELGELLRKVRRCPQGALAASEQIDPEQIAFLITRPRGPATGQPKWLCFLRALFCGIYTVDNMDFVLRDAYMSGYSRDAFDVDRLLHYSFFSERGLTIHARGLSALVKFMTVRAELFRSIYFHRTVRAIDLTLEELFAASGDLLFPGNPLQHRDKYREFTEMSLLVDVRRWAESGDKRRREVGAQWKAFLERRVNWKMACERTLFFDLADAEQASIFSRGDFVEAALREQLPAAIKNIELRVDLARHVHRPGTRGPTSGQNFLYDPSRGEIRELSDSDLVRQVPASYRICRVYARDHRHDALLAAALDGLVGPRQEDALTNM